MDRGELGDDDLVTFEEALALVGFSQATLYRRIADDKLRAVETDPERLFRRADVLALSARVDHRTSNRPGTDRASEAAATPSEESVQALRDENERLLGVIADLRMALREAQAESQATAVTTTRKTGHLLDAIERLTRERLHER